MSDVAVICPYCKKPAVLVHARDEGKVHSNRLIYLCRECDAYTGVHKNSDNYKPIGTMAKKELRTKRREVHQEFDWLWKRAGWTRTKAYGILGMMVGIPKGKTHIGYFTMEQCEKALKELTLMKEGKKWFFEAPKRRTGVGVHGRH